MHIIESGMQASDSIPATSSTISGIGISNMKITVAMTVAIIGTFIMLFILILFLFPLSLCMNITPTVYSRILNGIFPREARNMAFSP